MTEGRQLHVGPGVAAAAALSMLLTGAVATYVLMRDRRDSAPAPPPSRSEERAPAAGVAVTLTKDAIDRAGITVTQVSTQAATEKLRLPGIVEPDAYRQVTVMPLVAGRVVRAAAQLGDRVRKGQSLAEVYSPEVAEARTKYVAARAMLDAHDRELRRTEKLVDIGAASRQELERIHAEHTAQTSAVESARSRLRLLGAEIDTVSSANPQASATTHVTAPLDGVVTERLVNVGSTVDPATKLFTIVDLSNVWIVADIYERDLQRVQVGDRATVMAAAYPDRPFGGRVSFIDPQLNAAARTAKIRVEVANPRGDLRLGMYTDVVMESASVSAPIAIPKEAVQSVGDRHVVYLSIANDPGRFIEREVRLGRVLGDKVEVLAGLSSGDAVVAKGSFFIRAEAERLGLRNTQPAGSAMPTTSSAPNMNDVHAATIAVTEKGFAPDKVLVRAGVPARLIFVRTTDNTCATEVVFPSLNVKRALPLNQPIAIEFTPATAGDVTFMCGMKMLKGLVVVE
jgi:membrane fusion protein, heavy metal efflux system